MNDKLAGHKMTDSSWMRFESWDMLYSVPSSSFAASHFFEVLLRLLTITAPAFSALFSWLWIWNAVWYLNEPIPESWTWEGYKIKAAQEGA